MTERPASVEHTPALHCVQRGASVGQWRQTEINEAPLQRPAGTVLRTRPPERPLAAARDAGGASQSPTEAERTVAALLQPLRDSAGRHAATHTRIVSGSTD